MGDSPQEVAPQQVEETGPVNAENSDFCIGLNCTVVMTLPEDAVICTGITIMVAQPVTSADSVLAI